MFPAFLFHKDARSVNHEASVDQRILAPRTHEDSQR